MADNVTQHNIGALITERVASKALSFTAGGASDNATWTGISIDREALASGSLPDSALFALLFDATLASGKTLSVGLGVQDSADNSAFSDYSTLASAVVATGPSGGGAVQGQVPFAVDLGSARRYVRFNSLADMSATGTDTAVTIGSATLGGFDRLAAPA